MSKDKLCSICNEVKPTTMFKRGGRWCSSCRETELDEYLKQQKKQHHKDRGLELKEFMFHFLSLHKCVDCGEQNVLCLEFDHKNPLKKSFNLGKAHMNKDLTLKELVKEIAKCEVRCANCHAIKTHQEQDTWRWSKAQQQTSKEV